MRKPPPKEKGLANVKLIIESLPDRGRSSWHLGAVWALSQYQEGEVWNSLQLVYCAMEREGWIKVVERG